MHSSFLFQSQNGLKVPIFIIKHSKRNTGGTACPGFTSCHSCVGIKGSIFEEEEEVDLASSSSSSVIFQRTYRIPTTQIEIVIHFENDSIVKMILKTNKQ